jgi:predicted transcriptional regulator
MPTTSNDVIAMLSIHPEYVEAIAKGNKKIEFRKRSFKKNVKTILVYKTAPCQKIVGYFEIKEIKISTPNDIWNTYSNIGGVSEDVFFDYYNNSDSAVGILIEKFIPFSNPVQLTSYKIAPPQSYRYVSVNFFATLLRANNLSHNDRKDPPCTT